MPASASCRRTSAARTESCAFCWCCMRSEKIGVEGSSADLDVRVTSEALRVRVDQAKRVTLHPSRAHTSAFLRAQVSSAVCPAKQPGLLN